MRHRTTALRVTALGILAAMLIAADGEGDTGPQLDDHGWWWAMQTGLLELPAPPSVPEDGLLVGNGIDGPIAIAGIRYEIDDDDALGSTLVLEIADEQGGEVAGIRACAAIARWRGAQAGTWEHRPTSDCDEAEVRGQRDGDGETWSFDLAPFVDNGVANVILEPGPLEQPDEAGGGVPEGPSEGDEDDDGPAPSTGARAASQPIPDPDGGDDEVDSAPFQVAFEPPSDDAVEVLAVGGGDDFDAPDADELATGGEVGAGTPEPQDVPEPGQADSLEMSSAPQPSSPGDPGESSADPPQVAESEQPRQDDPVALVTGGEEQGEQAVSDPVAMEPSGFGDDRIRQLAALVALVAGLGALVTWRRPANLGTGLAGLRPSQIVRPEQAARSLPGRAEADQTTRGLGRFRRPRDGKAPPLA